MATRQWIIGNSHDVDVRVGDSRISARHCRLTAEGNRFFIEDLVSRNGTFVGSKRVAAKTAIDAGTKVRLADDVLMPWPIESLATTKIRIGRAKSNDVIIADDSVSGEHAVLYCDPNGVWILQDRGSTNGTQLGNRERIHAAARVTADDLIRLGSVTETLSSLTRQVSTRSPAPTAASQSSKAAATATSASKPAHHSPPRSTPFPLVRVRRIGAVLVLLGLAAASLRWASGPEETLPVSGNISVANAGPIDTDSGPSELSAGIKSASETVAIVRPGTSPPGSTVARPPVTAIVETSSPRPTARLTGLDRVRDAVFVIVFREMTDEGEAMEFERATAWAASREILVTNARAAAALQDAPNAAQVFHLTSGTILPIDEVGLHPEYESRLRDLTVSQQRYSDLSNIPDDATEEVTSLKAKLLALFETIHFQKAGVDAVDAAWIRLRSAPTSATASTRGRASASFSFLPIQSITPVTAGRSLRLVNSSVYSAAAESVFMPGIDRVVDFERTTATTPTIIQTDPSTPRWRLKIEDGPGDHRDFMYHGCPVVGLRGDLMGMYRGPARDLKADPLAPDTLAQTIDEFDLVPAATIRAMLQQRFPGTFP